jgi:hypothetical protein
VVADGIPSTKMMSLPRRDGPLRDHRRGSALWLAWMVLHGSMRATALQLHPAGCRDAMAADAEAGAVVEGGDVANRAQNIRRSGADELPDHLGLGRSTAAAVGPRLVSGREHSDRRQKSRAAQVRTAFDARLQSEA